MIPTYDEILADVAKSREADILKALVNAAFTVIWEVNAAQRAKAAQDELGKVADKIWAVGHVRSARRQLNQYAEKHSWQTVFEKLALRPETFGQLRVRPRAAKEQAKLPLKRFWGVQTDFPEPSDALRRRLIREERGFLKTSLGQMLERTKRQ